MRPGIKKIDGCFENNDKLVFAGNFDFHSIFDEFHKFRGCIFQ